MNDFLYCGAAPLKNRYDVKSFLQPGDIYSFFSDADVPLHYNPSVN
jgi:transcription elongation factor Elf1